jgi:hypothetical protein
MAESKYGKYVMREPRGVVEEDGKIVFEGLKVTPAMTGYDCSILYSAITQPEVNVSKPHSHDFPEFFGFFGSNSRDLYDFDAEIEMYLGGEKHVIDKTSVVYIPAGLDHCPLIFKRIGKPVMWLEVIMTPKYTRKPPKSG